LATSFLPGLFFRWNHWRIRQANIAFETIQFASLPRLGGFLDGVGLDRLIRDGFLLRTHLPWTLALPFPSSGIFHLSISFVGLGPSQPRLLVPRLYPLRVF